MNQLNMAEIFSTPLEYQPPVEGDLQHDSFYPNLNSLEYMKKAPDFNLKLQKFYESIDINSDGHAALGCNDYTSRIWNGSLWGFDKIDDVGIADHAAYKLQCASTITDLKFAEKNIILLSETSGSLQVWSTYSEVRSSSGYCLFMTGGKNEHVGSINRIDTFKKDKNKAVTVSNDYCIKIWDMGQADLNSTTTLKNAHFGSITDVSTNPLEDSVFVTSSRDKSALLWDNRLPLPASALYENYICSFTSIQYSADNNNLIYCGDESGLIYSIDTRKPKELLISIEALDSAINKIKFNGKFFAICGNSNEVKVFDASQNNKEIYSNNKSKNYVRDLSWYPLEDGVFCTVDWDSKMKKHKIVV